MAPASLSSLARTCIFCLSSLKPSSLLPQTQRVFRSTRSKQQIYLVVQLRKPYSLWGPRGTFVRVTPGFMRNVLYPRKIARYVVGRELKKLLESDTPIQRDRSFKYSPVVEDEDPLLKDWKATVSPQSSSKVSVTIPTTSPDRALALLQSHSQTKYTFYRRVNPNAAESVPSQQEQNADMAKWPVGTPIFGSVTTAEIAQAIKESVSNKDEASSIVIGPANIRVISGLFKGSDNMRLKALGSYEIEITLGKNFVLTKTVEIRPENEISQAELRNRDEATKSNIRA